MKTAKTIQKEIDVLLQKLREPETDRVKNRLNNQISLLRQYKIYIEINLKEQYLRDELDRLRDIITKKYQDFPVWLKNYSYDVNDDQALKMLRKEYEKVTAYSGIKSRIITLEYLLS